MATLLLNSARRKRAHKSRKTRSPAQRAATARMLAANRAKRGGATRKRGSSRRAVVHTNPVRRNPVSARRAFSRIRTSGAMSLLKTGAMSGIGAVAVDLLFGQLLRFLPASMATPQNADQSPNYLYFAAKAATAVAIGTMGKKVIPARFAEMAAVGSLTIMAYQLARSMVPASLTMGRMGRMGAYMNPATVVAPRQLNGMSAYMALPNGSAGRGTMAMARANPMTARR